MSTEAPRAGFRQERIESASQIPAHIDNLCRQDGAMPMRDSDAQLVALLDIGDKRLIALWAGEQSDRPVLIAAQQRAKHMGYTIVETRQASAEIIALCSESRKQQQNEEELEDTEATRMFDQVLGECVKLNASDMHLQIMRRHAVVVARVNGELMQLRTMTIKAAESLARAVYSQADVDSRMNKAGFNPRMTQDASITRSIVVGAEIKELKLRWASGPCWPDAFDVSLRILNISKDGETRTLESLGYSDAQCAALMHALKQPSGMILMCGTTGQGKSTTLATLAELWGRRYHGLRMLRTIEDPPEYVIKNARQMPVSRADKGASQEEAFNIALRAAMRMDPDALLIGEIRDAATADLSQQAVDTGHKVFSTQHAGSCFDAFWRAERLGIPRERLTSDGFINAIVHQALVPVICGKCSIPFSQDDVANEMRTEVATEFTAEDLEGARLRGAGCASCTGGISGRRALASILMPDTHLRMLIREGRESEAKIYWRTGKCRWHGDVQALSIADQARAHVRAGVLSPVDALLHLGSMEDEFDSTGKNIS